MDVTTQGLTSLVATVLRHYPSLGTGWQAVSLGNRGGFSGAQLWRIEGPTTHYCLRAWPAGDPSPERLAWIHRLMQQASRAGLAFVPVLIPTEQDAAWLAHAERLWEVATWMPGRADFHDEPSPPRIEAACTALAQLHLVWRETPAPLGPCPALARRWESAQTWLEIVRSGWTPSIVQDPADPVRPWAERCWSLLPRLLVDLPPMLEPWRKRSVPLQPCLCDIWHDHVLFLGERVTGIIDYGSMKWDHVAVDLARLLGSMVGDDPELRRLGLRAYCRVRPLSWEEEVLVDLLDATGSVIALANWMNWLYRIPKAFEDRRRVAARLGQLVERLENRRPGVVRAP